MSEVMAAAGSLDAAWLRPTHYPAPLAMARQARAAARRVVALAALAAGLAAQVAAGEAARD